MPRSRGASWRDLRWLPWAHGGVDCAVVHPLHIGWQPFARDESLPVYTEGSGCRRQGPQIQASATCGALRCPRPSAVAGRAVGGDVLQELRLPLRQWRLELDLQEGEGGWGMWWDGVRLGGGGWGGWGGGAEASGGTVLKFTGGWGGLPSNMLLIQQCASPPAAPGPHTQGRRPAFHKVPLHIHTRTHGPPTHLGAGGSELVKQRLHCPVARGHALAADAGAHHYPGTRGARGRAGRLSACCRTSAPASAPVPRLTVAWRLQTRQSRAAPQPPAL